MLNIKLSQKYMWLLLSLCCFQVGFASENWEWPSWRGPNQDGISLEKDFNPKALNQDLKTLWKVNLGVGYSNVTIVENALFTLGYDKKKKENILYSLNIESGAENWRYSYPASKGQYEGPKSTPVYSEGNIYHLGQDGDLKCHEAKTGKLVWTQHIVKDFGAEKLRWYFSSSPLIEGDLIIIGAYQSGIAFNKKTGELVWKGKKGKGNYATPVSFDFKGERLVAVYGNEHLFVVKLKTGEVLWSYPWETAWDIIASDPVIVDNKVLISTGYGIGSVVVDFSSGQPEMVWKNKDLCTHFDTAVVIDDYIYAVDGNAGKGDLKCVDFNTGKVMWSHKTGFGSVIAANGYLFLLNEKGTLYIIEATPEGYREVSKKEKILKKLCWTAPVLCRSKLYLRNNKGDLICLDISK